MYSRMASEHVSKKAGGEAGLRGGPRSGVDVLRGHLWGHLDDPGLVNYPGSAVALLHDANDPGLVALAVLGGLYFSTETCRLFSGQADQQAS